MSNAIIFDVAAPVSAASATLRFLSLLLVIDPMQLHDVSFSPSCMQIRTDRIIQKCQGQNLSTFILHAGNLCTSFLEFGMQRHFVK